MTRRREGLPVGDPRHGTINGYTNCGCKCEDCRRANRERQAQYREEALLRTLPPGDPAHGTRNGYDNHMCRCVPCSAANRAHVLERAERAYSTGERTKRRPRRAATQPGPAPLMTQEHTMNDTATTAAA